MAWIPLFLLLVCCVVTAASWSKLEDPLCIRKHCPPNTTCRVVQRCDRKSPHCYPVAKCIDNANPPAALNTVRDFCKVGAPLLKEDLMTGEVSGLNCSQRQWCPDGFYCKHTQRSSSVCCRSNPHAPTKPGRCILERYRHYPMCYVECVNDGDCHGDNKCCDVLFCDRFCKAPIPE